MIPDKNWVSRARHAGAKSRAITSVDPEVEAERSRMALEREAKIAAMLEAETSARAVHTGPTTAASLLAGQAPAPADVTPDEDEDEAPAAPEASEAVAEPVETPDPAPEAPPAPEPAPTPAKPRTKKH